MEDFKVGDVIILKSGGPKMTVQVVGQTNLTAVYFVEGNLRTEYLVKETVKKITDDNN